LAAGYLTDFHRSFHVEFAHTFIGSLPMTGSELSNLELATELEIAIDPNGKLHTLGVTKSSGNETYDHGAFNAVHRSAPYPPTPSEIRSPDGRTYIRWWLRRNESQCGTWNARLYVLRQPALK